VEIEARVAGWLRAAVERILGAPAAAVAAERSLVALGLDSLTAAELAEAIERELGVEVPFAALLEGPAAGELARTIAERMAAGGGNGGGAGGAASGPGEEEEAPGGPGEAAAAPGGGGASGRFPLTWGQRALGLVDRLVHGGNPAYVLGGAARVCGPLDAARLERALGGLVARHPALRTTFDLAAAEGAAAQVVHAAGRFSFAVEEAAAGAAEWGEAAIVERLAAEVHRPFDLGAGPLLRVKVWRDGAAGTWVSLAVHHIVADFWSLGIVLGELGALYDGRPLPPPPRLTCAEIAAEEERLLASSRCRPTGRGRRCRATPFMTLLTGYAALLGRWTGQQGVRVGTPASGRGGGERAGVVGYLVNPVAIAADLSGEPDLAALLGRVRAATLAAFAHQDLPFARVAELAPAESRDAARSPVFQSALVLYRKPPGSAAGLGALALAAGGAAFDLGGLRLQSVALPRRAAPFDLTLYAAETGAGGGLTVSLVWNADLFDAATGARLLGGLASLVEAMAAAAHETDAADDARRRRPVGMLPLLCAAERQQLREWNDSAAAFAGRDALLHQLIEEQAARTPEAVAVVAADAHLSYAALDERASRWAGLLCTLGVGAGGGGRRARPALPGPLHRAPRRPQGRRRLPAARPRAPARAPAPDARGLGRGGAPRRRRRLRRGARRAVRGGPPRLAAAR